MTLFDYPSLLKRGNDTEASRKLLEQQNRDALVFFPNIQIRDVLTVGGDRRLAYVGVEPTHFAAMSELLYQQRTLKTGIERVKKTREMFAKTQFAVPIETS